MLISIPEAYTTELRPIDLNLGLCFQVMERRDSEIKVHYVGWESSFDRWIPNKAVVNIMHPPQPSTVSRNERKEDLLYQLETELVQKLTTGWGQDPVVQFCLPIDEDVFDIVVDNLTKSTGSYHVANNNSLNLLFGSQDWWYRINNQNGDFSYLIQGTLYFDLKKTSVTKFELESDGVVIEKIYRKKPQIKVKFTKGEGPRCVYLSNTWKEPSSGSQ